MRRGLVWSLIFFIVVSVGALAATVGLGRTPLLGLDLKGGVSVVLQPQGTANQSALNEAVTIIERRVNGLGVSNSEVAVQGHTVVINLPGIKDSQHALAYLGTTAQLFFRPVYCEIPAYAAPSSTTTTTTPKTSTTRNQHAANTTVPTTGTTKSGLAAPAPARLTSAALPAAGSAPAPARLTSAALPAAGSSSTTVASPTTATTAAASNATSSTTTAPAAASGVSQSDCTASNAAQIPSTPASNDNQTASVILPVDAKAFVPSNFRYVLGPADMTGSSVSDATAVVDQNTGQYSVNLTLTSKGASEFDKIASQRYSCYQQSPSNPPPCSLEAFELDGVVESAPTFQASSFNGNVSITGNFNSSQASNLANQLKYGSLPVRFVPQSVQTVSATIGKDSLRAGLLAGIGGLIVVMIYMIVYYRALGLVVIAGLALGGALLYAILTELSYTNNLTLTLAGVTGIIVAIGITVDSYVVYFERLKDEVRAGRSVRQSTERSFHRAFRTVLTADLVSFMAALILYIMTVGDVRGFAFTLGLSTLLDVFTAWFFIRPAVILVGRRRAFTDNRILGINRGLGARTTPREA